MTGIIYRLRPIENCCDLRNINVFCHFDTCEFINHIQRCQLFFADSLGYISRLTFNTLIFFSTSILGSR